MRTKNLFLGTVAALLLAAPTVAQADVINYKPLTYGQKSILANRLNRNARADMVSQGLTDKKTAAKLKMYRPGDITGQATSSARWASGQPLTLTSVDATVGARSVMMPGGPHGPSGCFPPSFSQPALDIGASLQLKGAPGSRTSLKAFYTTPKNPPPLRR